MGIDAEMFVRSKRAVSDDALRAATHKLYSLFGPEALGLWGDHSLLERIEEWDQDGPTLIPDVIGLKDGEAIRETFIRVRVWTRYYGNGYERGDFRLLHDLAEALELIFPESAVWYGGDSSGVCAKPFGAKQRAALRRHWLRVAHEPYVRHVNPYMPEQEQGPTCNLCLIPMNRYGWGGGLNSKRGDAGFYAAYSCECGQRVDIHGDDERRTTHAQRRDEFYRLRNAAWDLLKAQSPADSSRLRDLGMEGF